MDYRHGVPDDVGGRVPDSASEPEASDIKAREADRTCLLAEQGHLILI
jgi:muconolactone delta-isomerase